ncbi:MAG: hypothetical protein V4684_20245 [Pseudomonadota bacterium]
MPCITRARAPAFAVLLVSSVLAACSPTFNWRDVHVEPTHLKALLPCKPEKASREVTMVERKVALEVLGCEAGGATFALLHADIGDASRAGDALRQWRIATLANLRGTSARDTAFTPAGATALPQSAQVVATGQRADGSKVQSHAAYFARGSQVFQAVIYTDELRMDMTDPFFSSLKFQ